MVLATFVGVALLAFLATRAPSAPVEPQPGLPGPDPIRHLFDTSAPIFFSGGSTTLSAAAEDADFQIEVPAATSVPSADKSPEVFLLPKSKGFALRYGADVVILSEPFDLKVDPAQMFTEQTEDRGLGYVTMIDGMAARVVPAGAKPTAEGVGRPTSADEITIIEMVRNDRLITAYARGASAVELTDMLETL
ncbi:MAG TPA: hypothetical protein VJ979_01920 [Actinomycetota bacterium]|nr:hypothetical protein [Actinomycetota bacterium]